MLVLHSDGAGVISMSGGHCCSRRHLDGRRARRRAEAEVASTASTAERALRPGETPASGSPSHVSGAFSRAVIRTHSKGRWWAVVRRSDSAGRRWEFRSVVRHAVPSAPWRKSQRGCEPAFFDKPRRTPRHRAGQNAVREPPQGAEAVYEDGRWIDAPAGLVLRVPGRAPRGRLRLSRRDGRRPPAHWGGGQP